MAAAAIVGRRPSLTPEHSVIVESSNYIGRDRPRVRVTRIDERDPVLRHDHRWNQQDDRAPGRQPIRANLDTCPTRGYRCPGWRQLVLLQFLTTRPNAVGNVDANQETIQRKAGVLDVRDRLEHRRRNHGSTVNDRFPAIVPATRVGGGGGAGQIIGRISACLGSDPPEIH